MHIERFEIASKSIDLSRIPHGWNLLTEDELTLVNHLLSGESIKQMLESAQISIEGRNLTVQRLNTSQTPYHTHIQLSGGYFTNVELHDNGIGRIDHTIRRANAENYVPTREKMFTSVAVTETGQIEETPHAYVPSGAYTQDQATIKTFHTLSIAAGLQEYAHTTSEPPPFLVPFILGMYRFSDLRDPHENPICGIAMLTPPPETRFDKKLTMFFQRNKNRRPDKVIREMNQTFFPQFLSIGHALRTLHDSFELYHRQCTGGNCGVVQLPDHTFMPFIADWQTLKRLPQNASAQNVARAVDIYSLWESIARLSRYFLQHNQASEYVASHVPTTVLLATMAGYLDIHRNEYPQFEQAFWTMTNKAEFEHDTLQALAQFLGQSDTTLGH